LEGKKERKSTPAIAEILRGGLQHGCGYPVNGDQGGKKAQSTLLLQQDGSTELQHWLEAEDRLAIPCFSLQPTDSLSYNAAFQNPSFLKP
jgi:hypothetical protein